MRDFKIIVSLADLHIGVKHIEAKDLKYQLKHNFLDPISKFEYLDGIFILGDLMHCIVSNNSAYAELFYWLIDKIYKIAKKKHSTVIIIKGTISHDNDQLNNIKFYQDNTDGIDFRIYDTVEEITIWNNYKILILPDVKVKLLADIDKYLKIPNKYDMILGHGTIDKMQFFNQESESNPTKTYIYDSEKLMDASKGPVLFGHIHQYQSYHSKFYYIGPFTMLERGSLNAGFGVIGIYDKNRSKYKVEHYINKDSANYYELEITKYVMDNYSIDDIIYAIDTILKDSKENDLITLRIIRGDEKNAADKVLMIESRYKKDKRISVKKKIKTKKEEEQENENKERKEKFSYLMGQSMDIAPIMYRYYKDEIEPTLPEGYSDKYDITEKNFERILKNKSSKGD